MKRLLTPVLLLSAVMSLQAMELSLDECREMALQTDENIRIAENNLTGASLDRGIARTAYLPKFAGNGTLIYSAPDTELMDMLTMQMRGAYMAGINLTQPVYAGGKIIAANKMAAAGQRISREMLRAARMDVIADAEKSYWTYVAVLSKVDMMESYLAMMDSVYGMTQVAVGSGMASRQALLRVDTRRSEILYRLRQARAGADICRMALCRVIGVADTVIITPTESPATTIALPENRAGISGRPEVAILAGNVDIKKHEVTMARADFLPTVGLQLGWSAYGNIKTKGWMQDQEGSYAPFSSESKSNGFMGMLAVQIPIFHWGEGIKKVKRAGLEVENARLSLQRNTRLMELEVAQNYSNLITGSELVKSADTAMAEADENLRLMQEQYEVGLATLTDLLEAQSQWHTSYSNVIEARTQYQINRIDYLRSTGEL
ncbi:MAG: TolC family protein [Duncaniella sp.]|nr:TolC family protein [Duncaniella sp.]MDE6582283.1 TolC family protein [Duncaniella sp.]